jgi:hypothetical protein
VKKKTPLYRKVNTTAHGVHHRAGGDFREQRKKEASSETGLSHQGMHGRQHRGLDYTPLFRFLLSKVGQGWNSVYSEAVTRLDRPEPIFWLVALQAADEHEYVRTGESSYFSGLRVDSDGTLQVVNPKMDANSLFPLCKCCTHTFNGVRFTRAFDPDAVPQSSAYRVAN